MGQASEFLLEPVIQNETTSTLIHALKIDKNTFLNFDEMADALQINYTESHKKLSTSFMGKNNQINLNHLTSDEKITIDNQPYFPTSFYEKYFPLKLAINPLDMQLLIDSEYQLPVTQKRERERRQSRLIPLQGLDSYTNYTFDERFFTLPVIDFSYQKNFSQFDVSPNGHKSYNSDAYQIDAGLLFAGLDTSLSVFGDSEISHHDPRTRLTFGRTFLEEPKNPLNLTTMEFGDVQSFNNTLFTTGNHGRGIALSSFKDLVLSADKTIDITGPLSEGWEVELYLNDQLIGFRRQGFAGRYEFKNIPVNYGLNAFKVVFYGPYGEIRSEDKHYYSGTSPVKKNAFGYTINAYQKNRYLFESNEPVTSTSDNLTTELTGYYGLTDYITLMAGFTRASAEQTTPENSFAHAGFQFIFSGASFQYNLMENLTDNETGHHVEIQGNIYIGDIFARYDYFGDLKSPTSYYGDRYLKNQFEGRLTGSFPFIFNLPYYVSYKDSRDHADFHAQEIQARLSPNFMRYYNFSIENTYYKDNDQEQDSLLFLLQAQYNNFGIYAQSRYRVTPDAHLQNAGLKLDYRWDRSTFVQADWTHEFPFHEMDQKSSDAFTLSASRLFPFGGLQLSLGADTNNNYSAQLTYNISIGKTPGQNTLFADARTTMTENAALHITAVDENNTPMPNVRFIITSWPTPFTTDATGGVLVSDLQPYQKTILSVDMNSIEDLSLIPEFLEKKVILRPGAIFPVEFKFVHKGEVEGILINNNRPYLYKVVLLDQTNTQITAKKPSRDGSFVLENISFGTYTLAIENKDGIVVHTQPLIIDQAFTSLNTAIKIP